MKGPPNHITVQEACERLCVSRQTFYKYYRRRLVVNTRHKLARVWLPQLEAMIKDEVEAAPLPEKKLKPPTRKWLDCPHCDKGYQSAKWLARHVKMKHQQQTVDAAEELGCPDE